MLVSFHYRRLTTMTTSCLQAEYMNDLLARRNASQQLSAGQVTLLEGLLTRFASFSTGLRM